MKTSSCTVRYPFASRGLRDSAGSSPAFSSSEETSESLDKWIGEEKIQKLSPRERELFGHLQSDISILKAAEQMNIAPSTARVFFHASKESCAAGCRRLIRVVARATTSPHYHRRRHEHSNGAEADSPPILIASWSLLRAISQKPSLARRGPILARSFQPG